MTIIDPGQAMVKKNKSGSYDITYKSSSGTKKQGTTLHLDSYKTAAELENYLRKKAAPKYKLSEAQILTILKDSGRVDSPVIEQATAPDADAFYSKNSPGGMAGKNPNTLGVVQYDFKTGERLAEGATTVDENGKVYKQGDKFVVAPATIETPAPTPLNPTTKALYAQGSSGDNVKEYQSLLGITADGIFGPQTKSAIMSFQEKNGLQVDGIVGPQTQAAFDKLKAGDPNIVKYGATTVATPTPATTKAPATATSGTGEKTALSEIETAKAKQAEIKIIDDDFNAEQEKELAKFSKSLGETVDTSDSEKLLKAINDSFEDQDDIKVPKTKSMAELAAERRAALGVDEKETEMNNIDAKIAALDAEFETLDDNTTNRKTSVLQINRRKSDQQIKYEDERRKLVNQKEGIVNELNQKYSVIDSMVKYASMDEANEQQAYQNATEAYKSKFNQALTLLTTIRGVEEDKKSEIEKRTDKARANLTVMAEVLKGKDYSNLDSATQLDIRKMELEAGLPSGFMKFATVEVKEPIVSIGSEFTDASGKRQVPVYTQDPATGLVTSKVITLGTAKAEGSGSTDKSTESEREAAALNAYSSAFVAGAQMSDGTPVMDNNGFLTPKAFKEAVADYSGTRKSFIERYGYLLYSEDLGSYGLTLQEQKLILGS